MAGPLLIVVCLGLVLNDGSGGASVGAGAAAGALIGVNLVDVALGDCSDGALVDAGTASNTDVSDFVSHFFNFLG
jgi:hypothetical protein